MRNCVTISDVLEVGRVEIDGYDPAPLTLSLLTLSLWSNEPSNYLSGKLVGRQMWCDEFSDGLDPAVLRADMKVSRGTRFSKAIVQTEKMCVPPLGAD